jgi:hypothetical protein
LKLPHKDQLKIKQILTNEIKKSIKTQIDEDIGKNNQGQKHKQHKKNHPSLFAPCFFKGITNMSSVLIFFERK